MSDWMFVSNDIFIRHALVNFLHPEVTRGGEGDLFHFLYPLILKLQKLLNHLKNSFLFHCIFSNFLL